MIVDTVDQTLGRMSISKSLTKKQFLRS